MLQEHRVSIWVRRGGPNYSEGLKAMHALEAVLGIPVHVYGPETHITGIVPMALGLMPPGPSALVAQRSDFSTSATAGSGASLTSMGGGGGGGDGEKSGTIGAGGGDAATEGDVPSLAEGLADASALLTPKTQCIVFGMQVRAVQGMLDFDYLCKRETPSVAALVFPFSGNHFLKFYWGSSEVMIPVYQKMSEAMQTHSDVDVFINFASFRSAFDTSMEALTFPQIRTVRQ